VQDVRDGDLLLGPDGGPRKVFNTVKGEERLYRIKIDARKDDLIVTGNHILVLHLAKSSGNVLDGPTVRNHHRLADRFNELSDPSLSPDLADLDKHDITASEQYETIEMTAVEFAALSVQERSKYRLFTSPGFDLPESHVPVNPYFLGLWLGGGIHGNTDITGNHEALIHDFLASHAAKLDLHMAWYGKLASSQLRASTVQEQAGTAIFEEPLSQLMSNMDVAKLVGPPCVSKGRRDSAQDLETDIYDMDLELVETISEDEVSGDEDITGDDTHISTHEIPGRPSHLERQRVTRLQASRREYGDLRLEEEEDLAERMVNPEASDTSLGLAGAKTGRVNTLLRALDGLGLRMPGTERTGSDKKRIPQVYLKNSRSVRLAVLAGLLDFDGWYVFPKNMFGFAQSETWHSTLFWDTVALARSLGFSVWTKRRLMWNPTRTKQFPQLIAEIFGNLAEIPCLLARKKGVSRSIPHMHSFMVKDIVLEVEPSKWAGFRVDQDQLYLRNDYLVLHNSGFEESMKFKKLTNAQRSGLNQIPNRRKVQLSIYREFPLTTR
jgi:pre-mRNA-processing factor 8